ncbi:GDSL-type esterase/lipase family protein [Robertkochia aurantiaca]|uniref:GDSL-type esterase/lipase family protein n=1 Tax=Robertkochia aurantiaca TaxID=2873700 RepID=UPI001CCBE3BC|nr:GDSL-type esterase/lipase family protein [Robertkochia sp. 3YJGBD-33]
MDPRKISFFIISCLVLLLLLTAFSREGSDEAGNEQEGFFWGNTGFKYPTFRSFLDPEPAVVTPVAQIDSIVGNIESMIVEEALPEAQPVVPDYSKIDTSKIRRIEYPGDPATFVRTIRTAFTSPTCRIIHYGDSQLEGDRISAYVRNRLQRLYGGEGPGFIPIKQVYDEVKAHVECSDEWLRFAAFDRNQPMFEHGMYGAYASVSRFTLPADSLRTLYPDSIPLTTAEFTVSFSDRSYRKLRDFKIVDLHYGNVQSPVSMNVFHQDSLIMTDTLEPGVEYRNLRLQFETAPTALRFEFTSEISPDFYGLTLDGKKGILLDNVAMRGASGTIFAKMDGQNYRSMMGHLQPRMFIFQYGGNAVPYLKDSAAVRRYSKYIMSNLNWVRKKAPEAPVIFIGPSDMSTRVDGRLQSYDLLPYVNEQIRERCLENGIAFWSMYDAMGGSNSMPHWVDQKLAASDYTHFSPKGTRVISELFFTSLYLDLTQYAHE